MGLQNLVRRVTTHGQGCKAADFDGFVAASGAGAWPIEQCLGYRGRTKALPPERAGELRKRAGEGEQKTALAREFGISRETLYRYLKAGGGRDRCGQLQTKNNPWVGDFETDSRPDPHGTCLDGFGGTGKCSRQGIRQSLGI
jgi:hypothetical protein